MYKTSAAYNAFVCHKRTLGTTLEVCLGESGGDCSTASLSREVGFSARSPKHLDAPWISCQWHQRHNSVRNKAGHRFTLRREGYIRGDVAPSEVAHGV